MALKIEAGKRYLAETNQIFGPLEPSGLCFRDPLTEGKWYADGKSARRDWPDLVREWVEPGSMPVSSAEVDKAENVPLLDVTIADGKYTIRQTSTLQPAVALRYGEPWPAFAIKSPDNLHMALAHEVQSLREQLAEADTIDWLNTLAGEFGCRLGTIRSVWLRSQLEELQELRKRRLSTQREQMRLLLECMFTGWMIREKSWVDEDHKYTKTEEEAMIEACGGDKFKGELLVLFSYWSNDIQSVAAHYCVALIDGEVKGIDAPPTPEHWWDADDKCWREPEPRDDKVEVIAVDPQAIAT